MFWQVWHIKLRLIDLILSANCICTSDSTLKVSKGRFRLEFQNRQFFLVQYSESFRECTLIIEIIKSPFGLKQLIEGSYFVFSQNYRDQISQSHFKGGLQKHVGPFKKWTWWSAAAIVTLCTVKETTVPVLRRVLPKNFFQDNSKFHAFHEFYWVL